MLAIAVGAAWLDARQTQNAIRLDVAKRLSEIESGEQGDRAAMKETQESLREAQAKIALLENRLAESQTQQAALEALYRELAPSRDEWALTEIEQVLLLASQQLQLAGNVSSALAALQLADAKLQRLDRPQFTPLRRALSRDMDRLKAVPFVDVTGLSLRLDQAIATIDTLPLALEERLPAAPSSAPPADESGMAALPARGLARSARPGAHREPRSPGGAAARAAAAVFPAREPQAAPDGGALRPVLARPGVVSRRPRRGRSVASQVLRHALRRRYSR